MNTVVINFSDGSKGWIDNVKDVCIVHGEVQIIYGVAGELEVDYELSNITWLHVM